MSNLAGTVRTVLLLQHALDAGFMPGRLQYRCIAKRTAVLQRTACAHTNT